MKLLLKYNLQFFGEDNDSGTNSDSENNNDNDSGNNDDTLGDKIDTQAFADIISEKDKEIKELQKGLEEVKKTNAQLLLRVNAGNRTEKTFEENLLELVGYKPRKE